MDFSPLLEKYPIEEHEEIHRMRMDHFKQLKLEEFNDSPAGKFVIEYFDALINGIDARLLSAEPFQVGEREVFIERRQNFRLFKSLFELARKRADNIEEFAKSKL